MAKYRNKTVEVEAIQFLDTPEQLDIISDFIGDVTVCYSGIEPVIHVWSSEHIMTASVGDFIIRGADNELYSCKPDIFEKTYERM